MRLNQVTMGATDIALTRAFYLKLGFTLVVDTDHYLRFSCPEGAATFSCVHQTTVHSSTTIYFEHKALNKCVQELVSRGIEFLQLPTHQPYLWEEAILKDPSGNRIKLYWAGGNRLNPPWRVTG